MSNTAICRLCLAQDVKLFSILNTPLQEIYEKITNISLSSDERKLTLACFLCRFRLHKCHVLMTRALNADQTLTQWLQGSIPLLPVNLYNLSDGLCISPIEHFSTLHIEPLDDNVAGTSAIKTELGSVKSEEGAVKCEPESDKVTDEDVYDETAVEHCQQSEDNRWSSSDSEDDVPLQAISKKAKPILKKSRVRVEKRDLNGKKIKRNREFKADFAREIILTKEQQLAELQARAQSLNYLNSPLKCDHCYKGFIHERAYENHMRKHDESSGLHECEICRMRYSTGRQLRTHANSVHSRRYQCGKCGYRSHAANLAREHEKWHNGYTYVCKLCGQTFRKPTSHLTHMRKRHPSSHVCDVCGDSFVGRTGLLMHKSKAHRGDEVANSSEPASDRFCAECDIQFVTMEAWKRHILSSAKHIVKGNEASPACAICGDRYSSSSDLREHLREHERALRALKGGAPAQGGGLPCGQCPLKFMNRSKLSAHVKRKHLGLKYNKNIVCEVCGKKCTSNANLKYHQRTHTGEKPYQCTVCTKRFADNNRLRIHTRTHTGERPYCCASCGKRFSQKPALNRHYRVHTGAKPYICQFCSKPFSQSNSLTLHVRTVHLKMPAKRRNRQNKQKQENDVVETVTQ